MIYQNANWIKCGKCGTEFDLDKNVTGCPLCGFGETSKIAREINTITVASGTEKDHLSKPPFIALREGVPIINDEARVWGSWVMFNDFFAPKFLARVLAWKLKEEQSDYIVLRELITDAKKVIQKHSLSRFKGFPKEVKNETAIGRLVHHFLKTFTDMGFFDARTKKGTFENVWKESWDDIHISLNAEGLGFAQIENQIFDEKNKIQILTKEEAEFVIGYLKQIDSLGYREYSTLKEVYEFLKRGKNGNRDLWNWFESNDRFQSYLRRTSKRTKNNEEAYKKQLRNYAKTFASSKVSLLRELNLITNKRSDYSIVGEFE